jgi:hypothetical protein
VKLLAISDTEGWRHVFTTMKIPFEVLNVLQHVFEKWVERCKKCIACQEIYFKI